MCPTSWDPMVCSMPGSSDPHYLLEFAQIHVHWFGDAIQPSHPLPPLILLSPIFPGSRVFPVCQIFASGGQSIAASGSVIPVSIPGWFPLGLTGLISLQSKELSRVFPSTTTQSINSLVLSLLYGPTLTSVQDYWKNHSFDKPLLEKCCLCFFVFIFIVFFFFFFFFFTEVLLMYISGV